MIAPVTHRERAREYLVRAEEAHHHRRKCRYLRLAVRNTVRAQALEAHASQAEWNEGSAGTKPTPQD